MTFQWHFTGVFSRAGLLPHDNTGDATRVMKALHLSVPSCPDNEFLVYLRSAASYEAHRSVDTEGVRQKMSQGCLSIRPQV